MYFMLNTLCVFIAKWFWEEIIENMMICPIAKPIMKNYLKKNASFARNPFLETPLR